MLKEIIGNAFAKEIDSVFTDQECADLIDISEKKGYRSKQRNKFGDTIDNPSIRSDDHVSVANAALVKNLQARIQPLLPARIDDKPFSCLQNSLKFNRYSVGQDFKPHSDSPLIKNKKQSLLTVMIYLNSDFKGGNTRFFNVENMLHHDIVPKTGKILIFDQDLYHAGLKVTSGTKYCLRLDVMYADKDTKNFKTKLQGTLSLKKGYKLRADGRLRFRPGKRD